MKSQLIPFHSRGSQGRLSPPNAGSSDGESHRRIFPVVGLFIVAPLVAEFLLGNMSITHLGLLAILAPLYGGGAILIRECVRRSRRDWPSIFLLALAYGILEEAFLTESLFNPNYLGKHLHLLQPAFISNFGIGAWYTVFVLTLHTVWSIPVPIALIEALDPEHAESQWLGNAGIGFVATVFALACVSICSFTLRTDPNHFVASRVQFAWSAVVMLLLIALAFTLPRRAAIRRTGRAPNPWIPGIVSFTLASAFLIIPNSWGGWAVFAYLSFDASALLLISVWSGDRGWRASHRLALAAGAATAYAWHAFVQTPSLGNTGAVTRMGNAVFAIGLLILLAMGSIRTHRTMDRSSDWKVQ